MRLASLYGPDAIARTPRAARFATEGEVRVVFVGQVRESGHTQHPTPRECISPFT